MYLYLDLLMLVRYQEDSRDQKCLEYRKSAPLTFGFAFAQRSMGFPVYLYRDAVMLPISTDRLRDLIYRRISFFEAVTSAVASP